MTIIIAVFGALVAGLCVVGFVSPDKLRQMFGHLSEQAAWVLAVVVRLGLGTLLLVVAEDLKFSYAMTILGWIAIIAAVVVLLMGPERLARLVQWWLHKLSDTVLRLSMLFGAAFGVFFIYVAI